MVQINSELDYKNPSMMVMELLPKRHSQMWVARARTPYGLHMSVIVKLSLNTLSELSSYANSLYNSTWKEGNVLIERHVTNN